MDNTTLRLAWENVFCPKKAESVLSCLSNISEHSYSNGVLVSSGSLGGLKVIVSERGIKIQNSLTKYVLGDNLKTAGRKDVQLAIEKLSDTLHVDVKRAIVTQLEFGRNITTLYPVPLYLNHLGDSRYHQRYRQKNGINYKSTEREFVVYDKLAEMKAKREHIPELYAGKYVIRMETCYQRNLAAHFNQPVITAEMLYDESFYTDVFKDWCIEYWQIDKLKMFQIDMSSFRTRKELQELGVLALVEKSGGELAMIESINERQKMGEITRKQAHDLRDEVKKCCKLELQTRQSELIIELDKKVKETARYFR